MCWPVLGTGVHRAHQTHPVGDVWISNMRHATMLAYGGHDGRIDDDVQGEIRLDESPRDDQIDESHHWE